MKKKAFVIDVDGTETPIKPKNGKTFTLAEIQAAIGGGYVEMVRLPDGRMMFVDEDGLMKRLVPNMQASVLCGRPIVGKALVCDEGMAI